MRGVVADQCNNSGWFLPKGMFAANTGNYCENLPTRQEGASLPPFLMIYGCRNTRRKAFSILSNLNEHEPFRWLTRFNYSTKVLKVKGKT
jgi:hypothetical protein